MMYMRTYAEIRDRYAEVHNGYAEVRGSSRRIRDGFASGCTEVRDGFASSRRGYAMLSMNRPIIPVRMLMLHSLSPQMRKPGLVRMMYGRRTSELWTTPNEKFPTQKCQMIG